MKITEYRAYEILCWLDDQAGDHTNLFEQMTLFRDAAALIRQLRDAEQAAWHAGLDAGREQEMAKDHAQQPAAVDGAMVERLADAVKGEPGWSCLNPQARIEKARRYLALATQPEGSDNGSV